jgi:hypothetical protein
MFEVQKGLVKMCGTWDNRTQQLRFEQVLPRHEKTYYVGVLISLWLFLFAAQPKKFLLDGLKKLEQRSHKCVELRGEYVE